MILELRSITAAQHGTRDCFIGSVAQSTKRMLVSNMKWQDVDGISHMMQQVYIGKIVQNINCKQPVQIK